MEAVVVEMGVRKVMLETLRCSCSETAKTGAVGGVAEGKRLLQAVLVDHQFSSVDKTKCVILEEELE